MARLILIIVLICILLAGCTTPTPDPSEVEELIQGTLTAQSTTTPKPTSTPLPTNTPAPTNTLEPSNTPEPSRTPRPYEEFYSYTNKFIEMFNQVTKLRDETDEIKLNEIYFKNVDGKTTLFVSLNNIPSRIADGSVLALPVTIMQDIRDNKKAKIPGDINKIVITSFNMESEKKLTININWPDLREYIDGNITFNQFFALVEQVRH